MRLTRSPIQAAYKPTTIAAAPISQGRAAGGPAQERRRTSLADIRRGQRERRIKLAIIAASIAGIGILIVAAILVVRAYHISTASILAMLPRGAPVQVVADKPVVAPVAQAPAPARNGVVTSKALSRWQEQTFVPLDPTFVAIQTFKTQQIFPVGLDILEGGTVQSDQTRIKLARISSLPANAVCMSDQQTKFACGLMARASLSIMISGEKLACYPDVSLESDNPLYICQARGRDLALAQLEAGFALPSQPSVDGLNKLEGEAQAGHTGAWNGGWSIVPTGAPQP